MKNIGFIGTGFMGVSMVRNLMKAGFQVSIFTRTKAKAEELIAEGAQWCDSIEELAQNKDAVITIVGYPQDVEEVYFQKLLPSITPHTYLIDMTTSSPELAQRIYQAAKEKQAYALDAPVSGGKIGAKNGTLSIMVGGEQKAFEACMTLFEAMGKMISLVGGPGAGQIAKAANQTAIAGTLAGLCEAITLVRKAGVEPQKVMDVISGGAAGSFQLNHNAKPIINDDMSPTFYLKHYVKDLKIALHSAESNHANLPVLSTVLHLFEELENEGEGDYGIQALIHKYK